MQIDAYERALEVTKKSGTDHRLVIQHCQTPREDQLERTRILLRSSQLRAAAPADGGDDAGLEGSQAVVRAREQRLRLVLHVLAHPVHLGTRRGRVTDTAGRTGSGRCVSGREAGVVRGGGRREAGERRS